MARTTPHERVRQRLAPLLGRACLDALPRGYQRVGDVVIVDLPLPAPEADVAQAYALALGARSVLGRDGGIEGALTRRGL